MTEQMTPRHEAIVRRLRDNIYGPQAPGGWDGCKHNWLKPENVRWLLDQPQNKKETVPIELLK